MEKMYTDDNDEIEIDIRELLFEFKKKFWIILLSIILGAAAVGAWSMFLITPQYKSEATLYVLSKETTLTSLADLQIGSQLTQDYKVLVSSRPVMEGVISHLNLNLSYKELEKKLEVGNPQNTRILSLTVEDADPYMAKAIVDDIANTASDYIGEIMEMIPPKLIEDGVVAVEPFSPSIVKNALIGAVVALLLVCGLITMRVVMNDTVKTEEDVAKYLGLPVLAVIPKKSEKENKKKGQTHDGGGRSSSSDKRALRKRERESAATSEPASRRKGKTAEKVQPDNIVKRGENTKGENAKGENAKGENTGAESIREENTNE